MRRLALGLAMAVVIGLWVVSQRGAPPGGPVVPGVQPGAGMSDSVASEWAEPPDGVAADGSTDRRRAPRSLRGTAVDGALPVDATGHLVVTPEVRRFFDYFLALTGEEPLPRIRDRIVRAIAARLTPPASVDAEELLDRYLLYRDGARGLAADGVAAADLAARLEAVRALRRQTLGVATAGQLFADEEARDAAAVVAAGTTQDPTLTPEERAARLAALDADLPDDVRAARDAATLPLRLGAAEAALDAAGGSPEERRALRERMVGSEAAARLDALDRERADWQRRLDDYRAARAALAADAGRAPDARRVAEERLLSERFTPADRRRVEALERAAEPRS